MTKFSVRGIPTEHFDRLQHGGPDAKDLDGRPDGGLHGTHNGLDAVISRNSSSHAG